jgi:hypothetical protein
VAPSMADQGLAKAVLDRLCQASQRIALRGVSMRKRQPEPGDLAAMAVAHLEGVPRPSVSSAGTGARGFVAARGVVGMLPGAVVVVSPGRLRVPRLPI